MRRPPYEFACCLRRLVRLVACDICRCVTRVFGGGVSYSTIAAEAMIPPTPTDRDSASNAMTFQLPVLFASHIVCIVCKRSQL